MPTLRRKGLEVSTALNAAVSVPAHVLSPAANDVLPPSFLFGTYFLGQITSTKNLYQLKISHLVFTKWLIFSWYKFFCFTKWLIFS